MGDQDQDAKPLTPEEVDAMERNAFDNAGAYGDRRPLLATVHARDAENVRLRADVERLKLALRPFANSWFAGEFENGYLIAKPRSDARLDVDGWRDETGLTVADLQRARAALEKDDE